MRPNNEMNLTKSAPSRNRGLRGYLRVGQAKARHAAMKAPSGSRWSVPGACLAVLCAALLIAALAWERASLPWSLPEPLFFTALYIAGIRRAAWPVVGAMLLVVWAPELWVASSRVPVRSRVGLVLLTLLNAFDIWGGWEYTALYSGWLATGGFAVVSTASLIALWLLLIRALRRLAFEWNLLFHSGVVAWLVTVGAIMMNELP
jgi:hypothetical protein